MDSGISRRIPGSTIVASNNQKVVNYTKRRAMLELSGMYRAGYMCVNTYHIQLLHLTYNLDIK